MQKVERDCSTIVASPFPLSSLIFYIAGLAGNTAIVSALLQNGADANKINREGKTPLKVTTSLAVSKVFRGIAQLMRVY